jgi:hypothetical protein
MMRTTMSMRRDVVVDNRRARQRRSTTIVLDVPPATLAPSFLRNPISVSRNLWLLTIMVTEWFSTP